MRITPHIRLARLPTIKGATPIIPVLPVMAHLTLLECPLRSIDTTQIMTIVRWYCFLAPFINYCTVYGDDERQDPHGYPAPDMTNPRANHRSKPDSVPDLEAEIRNLPTNMQKYLRSLERKARKADVVSDTDEFLPNNLARMDLNGSNRSSPAPFSSENRDIPSARKRPVDNFASNASYATRPRSHASDYEASSDEEAPPNFRMKNIDSNNITTEYIADCDNNNSTYIETTREVKGLSISSQLRFYPFTNL